ncbi:MAG: hypothetical protein HY393_03345 [Candidatus Diapherotrites archaeon]|nr:hypothetical protein [Candidatus Diapherotrites archaeon]
MPGSARIHAKHHKRVYKEHFESERITFNIARFQPEVQPAGFFQSFHVHAHSGQTVLDCLEEIKQGQDSTLTFKRNCSNGVCGGCGMKVNGKAWLACTVQALEAARENKGALSLEPLSGRLVVRDLAVNEHSFMNTFFKGVPFLVPRKDEEKRAHRMTPREWKALGKSPTCILCMVCDSNAGALYMEGHLNPAAAVKAYRYQLDARDAGKAERLNALAREGLLGIEWDLNAANSCPRGIFPGQKTRALQRMAHRKGIKKV